MLWIPQKGRVLHEHNWGGTGTTNLGTSVTTGGAASTKGSFTELIASTSFDAYWVEIQASLYGSSGVPSDGCMDIAIGAASEDIIIPDLLMGYCGILGGNARGPRVWGFPLYIPAGTRISARAAGRRVSTALNIGVRLLGGDGSPHFRVGRKVTTYGMGTVPNGVAITPGVSGAEGSWTEITSGTSEDHFALLPGFQCTNDNTINARSYWTDIGLGAATEEEVLQSYLFNSDTTEFMDGPDPNYPMFLDIPSGTRLTLRASCSGTAPDTYDAVIHAVS